MFLAVDIGNTSTTLGFFDGSSLKNTHHFPTLKKIEEIPKDIAEEIGAFDVDSITIASVVPQATYRTSDALQSLFSSAEIRVLSHDDVPMKNDYKDPEEVGIDRLLGSLAAYTIFATPEQKSFIVIDFGTATVFDCISKTGMYLGGAISLGVESSALHLASIAAQLPEIPLEFPRQVLGKTTKESMQSGILFGAVAAMEGLVNRLRMEVFEGDKPIVVATGGLSLLLEGHTRSIDYVAPNLVLDGIRIVSGK